MYVYRNLHCILLLLFILISIICGGKLTFGTLDDIKASLDKERDDFNPLKSPEFVKVLNQSYQSQLPSRWELDTNCRLTYQSGGDSYLCLNLPNSYCLGWPIMYNYLSTEFTPPDVPNKFEIFSYFPSCWSRIRPLICARFFRPCVTNFTDYTNRNSKIKHYDLVQVYNPSFCLEAKKNCDFGTNSSFLALFSSVVDCENRINTLDVIDKDEIYFNDACKKSYPLSEIDDKNVHRCLSPLTGKTLTKVSIEAKPIIDECYMPCRSPLYGFETYGHFRTILLAANFLPIIATIIAGRYFFLNLKKSWHHIWVLSNILAFNVFRAIMSFAIISDLFAACVDNGNLRNYPNSMESCKIIAFFNLFFSLQIYGWIILFVIRCCFVTIRHSKQLIANALCSISIAFINDSEPTLLGICDFEISIVSMLLSFMLPFIILICAIIVGRALIDDEERIRESKLPFTHGNLNFSSDIKLVRDVEEQMPFKYLDTLNSSPDIKYKTWTSFFISFAATFSYLVISHLDRTININNEEERKIVLNHVLCVFESVVSANVSSGQRLSSNLTAFSNKDFYRSGLTHCPLIINNGFTALAFELFKVAFLPLLLCCLVAISISKNNVSNEEIMEFSTRKEVNSDNTQLDYIPCLPHNNNEDVGGIVHLSTNPGILHPRFNPPNIKPGSSKKHRRLPNFGNKKRRATNNHISRSNSDTFCDPEKLRACCEAPINQHFDIKQHFFDSTMREKPSSVTQLEKEAISLNYLPRTASSPSVITSVSQQNFNPSHFNNQIRQQQLTGTGTGTVNLFTINPQFNLTIISPNNLCPSNQPQTNTTQRNTKRGPMKHDEESDEEESESTITPHQSSDERDSNDFTSDQPDSEEERAYNEQRNLLEFQSTKTNTDYEIKGNNLHGNGLSYKDGEKLFLNMKDQHPCTSISLTQNKHSHDEIKLLNVLTTLQQIELPRNKGKKDHEMDNGSSGSSNRSSGSSNRSPPLDPLS